METPETSRYSLLSEGCDHGRSQVGVESNDVGVAMLGMAGIRLLAAEEIGGELELVVETDADLVGCHACGVRAVSHGRRETLVRDLPISGRPTRLRWRKRLWRCHEPLCATQTWTEQCEQIAPRAALTERAKTTICEQVGRDADRQRGRGAGESSLGRVASCASGA